MVRRGKYPFGTDSPGHIAVVERRRFVHSCVGGDMWQLL